jgi:hypothetical protein
MWDMNASFRIAQTVPEMQMSDPTFIGDEGRRDEETAVEYFERFAVKAINSAMQRKTKGIHNI